MRKWHYYSIGVITIIFFLVIVKFIIGSKILDLTDIYIPYYNSSQYYQSFFGLWKTSDAGEVGNAPISMLYSAILSSFGVSYTSMQFVVFTILVFFDYSSLFVLISYIAGGKYKLVLLLTFFLFFIEFRWAGFLAGTGINFFLAFAPFLIYFSLRMLKSEISPLRSIIFISLSFVGASFEITEAFPYSLFVYSPVLIMAIIQYIIKEHNLNSLKIFIEKQLIFLVGMFVGLLVLIYPYYPWILASLGAGSSNVSALKFTYSNTNIFIVNAFSSLGSGASMLGSVFGISGIYAFVFGVVFIFIVSAYIIKRRNDITVLSAFVFVMFLVIYAQLAISFPVELFRFITIFPFLSELLITINEPAQLFYLVVIWEYFIVGVTFFDLIQNYGALSKFLKIKLIKYGKRSVSSKANINKKPKPIFQTVLTVLTVIIFLNTLISVSSLATGHSSYTPYGNYDIQNYIPNYVHNIYETSASNSVNVDQKILLLPDYPRVERWEQTSPLFFTFPPSNTQQMSLFESFIEDIQNHIEIGTGNILGQMDIGYIAVINALNQSETGPIIGYDNFHQPYAILGNPAAFYNYFNSSPDFRLISNNRNYSMFMNLNNTGLFHIYSGEAVLNDNSYVFVENRSSNLQTIPQSSQAMISSITSVNILKNLTQSNYWTPFGKNITEEFQNSNMLVNFSSFSPGYYVSYLISGFPVSSGMTIKFSSSIKALNDSSSTYYDGFDFAYTNETIVPGHYWQNGIYHVQGNVINEASGLYMVPENVTYIIPWIAFHDATGSFTISNLSINIVQTGNGSSFPFAYKNPENRTTLSSQELGNMVQSLFPNSVLLFANSTGYIPNINSINVTIYNNSTSSTGLYIVPFFYLSEKYGYVWGNGNYSVLNPGSYEMGNLSLKYGFYHIEIKISGNGFGSIQINNISYIYNTLDDGVSTIQANISVGKILLLQIHNIVGEVKLYDVALVGPNLLHELDNMLTGALTEPSYRLNPKGSPSHFQLNLSINGSSVLVMKESFTDGWSISYDASGREHIEKPLLVNGYQMMFILPGNSSNISFAFQPPLIMSVQVYITVALVPASFLIALVMTLSDIRRRKCN